jgi:predicted nucleotidyltransferase
MDELGLPQEVAQALREFVDSARETLGADLVSLVLFGSAAEGRLRATSDVNVIVVLARFDIERIDALREPLRSAHGLIGLSAMLILESEIPAAAEAFAVKFADIHERHRILFGSDVFAALTSSREAMLTRLRQILLNYILRTRERYALVSLREEQLADVAADSAGPLRSAAAIILSLQGRPAPSPKAALESLAAEINGSGYASALANLSRARDEAALPPGVGRSTVLSLLDLAQALHGRALTLK